MPSSHLSQRIPLHIFLDPKLNEPSIIFSNHLTKQKHVYSILFRTYLSGSTKIQKVKTALLSALIF
jgi:hypothetical protein